MDQKHYEFIPRDDIYLFNTGHARKAWLCFGCRWIPELNEYRFIVWAPNARNVSLIGDFSCWNDIPMEFFEGGVWVCFVGNAQVGHHYKYKIFGAGPRQLPLSGMGDISSGRTGSLWKTVRIKTL